MVDGTLKKFAVRTNYELARKILDENSETGLDLDDGAGQTAYSLVEDIAHFLEDAGDLRGRALLFEASQLIKYSTRYDPQPGEVARDLRLLQ